MNQLHLPPRAFDAQAVWLEAVTAEERELAATYNTALYRFYDASNALLYVGISRSLPDRWNWHRCRTDWYARAHSVALSFYPSRRDAFRAEAAAIRTQHPQFNILRSRTRSVYPSADDPNWAPPQPEFPSGS
jgi:hypothetical protein